MRTSILNNEIADQMVVLRCGAVGDRGQQVGIAKLALLYIVRINRRGEHDRLAMRVSDVHRTPPLHLSHAGEKLALVKHVSTRHLPVAPGLRSGVQRRIIRWKVRVGEQLPILQHAREMQDDGLACSVARRSLAVLPDV